MFRLHDISGNYDDILLTNTMWGLRTPTMQLPPAKGVFSAARSISYNSARSSASPLVDTSQINVPPNAVVLGRSVSLPTPCRIYHNCISRAHLRVEVVAAKNGAKSVKATALGVNPVFVNGSLLRRGSSCSLQTGDTIEFLEARSSLTVEEKDGGTDNSAGRLIPPMTKWTPLGRRKRPRDGDEGGDDAISVSSRESVVVAGGSESKEVAPMSPWAVEERLLNIPLPTFTLLRRSQSPETSTTVAVRRECSESMPRGINPQIIQQLKDLDETPKLRSRKKRGRR